MAAVGLIADQLDCETYSMPTGARIFERGTPPRPSTRSARELWS
jgi:hypothetical protein